MNNNSNAIKFEDHELANALAYAFDKDVSQLTQAELESIVSLDIDFYESDGFSISVHRGSKRFDSYTPGKKRSGLITLRDLGKLANLESIYLISDISDSNGKHPDLKELPNNILLYLEGFNFNSIDDFINLPDDLKIASLKLSISNANSAFINKKLRTFKTLEKLILEDVSDVVVIDGLDNLKYCIISCTGNDNDFTYLSTLKDIEYLWISSDSPHSFSLNNLGHLNNLKVLNLNGIQNIDNLNGIQNFPVLEKLHCSGALLEDVSHISQAKLLVWLDLSDNLLTNIESIATLENLEYLDISFNEIENIEALSNFDNIKYLDITHLSIRDFDPIKPLVTLNTLYMRDAGRISKDKLVELVESLPNLEWLDCGYDHESWTIWACEQFPEINIGNKELEIAADWSFGENSRLNSESE